MRTTPSESAREFSSFRDPSGLVFTRGGMLYRQMAISNNLPLDMLAQWFASLSRNLIIEFVPKEDSQVQVLLATRADIFPDYTRQGFEDAFGQYFTLREKAPVRDSERTLYLWKRSMSGE